MRKEQQGAETVPMTKTVRQHNGQPRNDQIEKVRERKKSKESIDFFPQCGQFFFSLFLPIKQMLGQMVAN